jgi:preprotein translocase subunit SecG
MTSILLVVHVFAAVAIVVLVLMQQGRGADMGAAFGGGSQTLFGARGSANFLSRATGLLAAVFFVTSLTLAYMYGLSTTPQSVTDQIVTQPESSSAPVGADSDIPQAPDDAPQQGSGSDVPAVPEPAVPEPESGTEPVKE